MRVLSEGELIGAITKDEEETIVLIRKNVEETIALIFNCSSSAEETLASMRENIICLEKNRLTEKLRDLMPQ
ncbi:MAG: hypothetical protein ACLUN0_07890 [Roseburia sp.]